MNRPKFRRMRSANWSARKKPPTNNLRQRLETLESRVTPATFTVLNTADSGAGSLRQAILDANLAGGQNNISFSIAGPGPHSIHVLSALPTVTYPVVIDAATQPDFAGTPVVELEGSGAGSASGLVISTYLSTVRGLVINRFSGAGIAITSLFGNVIEGNYIGTDITGTIPLGNLTGVLISNAPNNIIGGPGPGQRNVISGNIGYGVNVFGASATGNRIQGNYIGTNAAGTAALGNATGVGLNSVTTVGGSTAGLGNVISGNSAFGLFLDVGATLSRVLGNFIGTDAVGSQAIGNHSGVRIRGSNIEVGGAGVAEGNVISGNAQAGVEIFDDISAGTSGNRLLHNYIGTDASGTVALGNTFGVFIANSGSNEVGHSIPSLGNTIAHNSSAGVVVISGTGNSIRGNSIFANGGLGIDLGSAGVTANDSGDSDTGANNLQNFPVLNSSVQFLSGVGTDVSGTLNSTPNTTFTMEFFYSPAGDQSGFGEGQTYFLTAFVTTDASGSGFFSFGSPTTIPIGYKVTATATDPAGNTSEFSNAVAVTTLNRPPVANAGGPYSAFEGGATTLTGSGSDPDGDALTYAWDLDNNGSYETAGQSVTFSAAGLDGPTSRTVGLRVNDPSGAAAFSTATVNVTNVAPTFEVLTLTPAINETQTAVLAGTISDPGTADTHSVTIDWGDGSTATSLNLPANVLTFNATHPYWDNRPANAPYSVLVTVADDDGGSQSTGSFVQLDQVSTPTPNVGGGPYLTVETAQTFTVGQTGRLSRIDLQMNKTGGSSNLLVELRATTSGTPQAANSPVLASVMLTPGDVPPTLGWVSIDLSAANVTVEAGQVLAIVLRMTDSTDGHGYNWVGSTGNPYAAGAGFVRNTVNGPAWIAFANGVDCAFKTYVDTGLPSPQVIVNNVAPIVAISGPSSATAGDLLTFTLTASDVSAIDQAAGFAYHIDWDGDGTIDESVTGPSGTTVSHTFATAGSYTVRVTSEDKDGGVSDPATLLVDVAPIVVPDSTVQGLVWVDFNDDGEVNFGEKAIAGVTVTLTGFDNLGNPVNLSTTTDGNGIYSFTDLRPSDATGYTIAESQPAGFADGQDGLGMIDGTFVGSDSVNDTFFGIVLPAGSLAENYNFGERPPNGGTVTSGQTATIGFWQNRNGQNLIKSLNGGETATQLGSWLAATFPNMYGMLDGMTNAYVAAHYKTLFGRTGQTSPGGPPKVDAQILATALAVYVTNQTLAGSTAAAYGFVVTQYGVGTATFNVGTRGTAFGVANGTALSVMDLLLAVNSRSSNGLLYDTNGDGVISAGEANLRTTANDLFSLINESGGV